MDPPGPNYTASFVENRKTTFSLTKHLAFREQKPKNLEHRVITKAVSNGIKTRENSRESILFSKPNIDNIESDLVSNFCREVPTTSLLVESFRQFKYSSQNIQNLQAAIKFTIRIVELFYCLNY